jgi:hypothetical protein
MLNTPYIILTHIQNLNDKEFTTSEIFRFEEKINSRTNNIEEKKILKDFLTFSFNKNNFFILINNIGNLIEKQKTESLYFYIRKIAENNYFCVKGSDFLEFSEIKTEFNCFELDPKFTQYDINSAIDKKNYSVLFSVENFPYNYFLEMLKEIKNGLVKNGRSKFMIFHYNETNENENDENLNMEIYRCLQFENELISYRYILPVEASVLCSDNSFIEYRHVIIPRHLMGLIKVLEKFKVKDRYIVNLQFLRENEYSKDEGKMKILKIEIRAIDPNDELSSKIHLSFNTLYFTCHNNEEEEMYLNNNNLN